MLSKLESISLAVFLFMAQGARAENKSDSRPGAVSLPSAGGTIEKDTGDFSNDVFRGTIGFRFPLALPKGPGGSQPDLGLSYQTGSGSGPLGLGWDLGVPEITRDPSQGVPTYAVDADGRFQDDFRWQGQRLIFHSAEAGVFRYRLEKSSSKVSIEFHSGAIQVGTYAMPQGGWIVRLSDGRQDLFPQEPCHVIQDVAATGACANDPMTARISSWKLGATIPRNQQPILYHYEKVQGEILLRRVSYGPQEIILSSFPTKRFDSGVRMDAGFPVLSQNLYSSIRVMDRGRLHRRYCMVYRVAKGRGLTGENLDLLHEADCLPKDGAKSPYAKGSQLINTISFLERILSVSAEGSIQTMDLRHPEVFFGYSPWFADEETKARKLVFPAFGFGAATTSSSGLNEFLDLNHDGLPDIVEAADGSIRYKLNKGQGLTKDDAIGLQALPNMAFQPNLARGDDQIADMNGDGFADYVQVRNGKLIYYPGRGTDGIPGFQKTSTTLLLPTQFGGGTAFFDGKVKVLDLNNDGYADLLTQWTSSTGAGLYVALNQKGQGFKVSRPRLAPSFTRWITTSFLKLNEVWFRDLNGDGLPDAILPDQAGRGFRVFYHLGRIEEQSATSPLMFGVLSGMKEDANGGIFLTIPNVSSSIIKDSTWFLDANADGLSDMVYSLGTNELHVRLNPGQGQFPIKEDYILKNNGTAIPNSPALTRIADFDGDGQEEVLFVSTGKFYFMDLNRREDAGKTSQLIKSGLLTRIAFEGGKRIDLQYATSMDEYERDRKPGSGITTARYLPFPRVIVKRITESAGAKADLYNNKVTEFLYHDGAYDSQRREFLGFTHVEQISYGDDSQPGSIRDQYFHSGLPDDGGIGQSGLLKREAQYPLVESFYLEQSVLTEDFPFASAFIHSLSGYALDQKVLKLETPQAFREAEFRYKSRVVDGSTLTCPESAEETAYGLDRRNFRRTTRTTVCDDYGNIKQSLSKSVLQDGLRSRESGYTEDFDYDIKEDKHLYQLQQSHKVTASGQLQRWTWQDYDSDGYVEKRKQWIEGEQFKIEGFDYDPFGNLQKTKNAKGEATDIIYDSDGINIIQTVNPKGHRISIFYLCRDVTFPLGLSCEESDKPVASSDANGVFTYYAYDAIGRLKELQRSNGEQITYDYRRGREGELNRVYTLMRTEAKGRLFAKAFFSLPTGENLATISQARDHQMRVESYRKTNRLGQVFESYVPYFGSGTVHEAFESGLVPAPASDEKRIRHRYDVQGRLLAREEIGGGSCRYYQHDAGSMLETFDYATIRATTTESCFDRAPTDRLDRRLELKRTYFDENGQAIGLRYGEPQTVVADQGSYLSLERDALGRPTTLKDAAGAVTQYLYTGLDQIREVNSPVLGRQVLAYTADGYVDHRDIYGLSGKKVGTLRFAYDSLGRLTERYHDQVKVESYFYDEILGFAYGCGPTPQYPLGRLSRVITSSATRLYAYNSRGEISCQPTQMGDDLYVERTDYDLLGRMNWVQSPAGQTTVYSYADDLYLDQVEGFLNAALFNERGQIEKLTYTNGITTSYGYSSQLLINHINSQTPDGKILQDLWFDINGAGYIEKVSDAIEDPMHTSMTASYAFDGAGQLTGYERGKSKASFRYDAAGNFLQNDDFAPGEDLGPYLGTWHKAKGSKNKAYAYGDRGELISTPRIEKIEWDLDLRPVRMKLRNGSMVSYTYDQDGTRLQKTVRNAQGQDALTRTISPRFHVEEGTEITYVLIGKERLGRIEHRQGGDRSFTYLRDHLTGSNILVDQSGQIVEQAAYKPFGTEWSNSPAFQAYQARPEVARPLRLPQRFAGQYQDAEHGLYDLNARMYDPDLGRFASPDHFFAMQPELCLQSPIECNLYSYARNNPLKYVDPNGTCSQVPNGVCVEAFISMEKFGAFNAGFGDNRSFAANDPSKSNRYEFHISYDGKNPVVQKLPDTMSEAGYGPVRKGYESATAFSVSPMDRSDNSFSLTIQAKNGWYKEWGGGKLDWALPDELKQNIDAAYKFQIGKDGSVHMMETKHDAFPSHAVYSYDSKGNVNRDTYEFQETTIDRLDGRYPINHRVSP